MKRRTVKVLVAIVATAVLIGCSNMVTVDTTEASTTIDSNYLDMNTVIGYSGTTAGLQLYTNDGNGYYWETENIQANTTQIYYTMSEDDLNTLIPILENRNGKIIIEVIEGTVSDADGNGIDSCGNYIHYDMDKFSIGDKVQTVFVYNPGSNAIDDILYRVDVLIK